MNPDFGIKLLTELKEEKEKRQNIRNMYSKVIPEDNFDILDMAIDERSYRNVKWFLYMLNLYMYKNAE